MYNEHGLIMTLTWEEQRDSLCDRIEKDFQLKNFSNRNFPIVALTSNDIISKDINFKKNMKKNGQKNLAAVGDTVIDFLIVDHFSTECSQKNAKDLNSLRESYGKNRTLHRISKTVDVNLKDYIISTENDPCWENGITCLAVYFEALVGIIFLEHGIDEAKKFLNLISFFENVKKMYEFE